MVRLRQDFAPSEEEEGPYSRLPVFSAQGDFCLHRPCTGTYPSVQGSVEGLSNNAWSGNYFVNLCEPESSEFGHIPSELLQAG